MVSVFVATAALMFATINTQPKEVPPVGAPVGPPGTAPAVIGSPPANPPNPGSFGAFDTNQSGQLSTYSRYLIAAVIMVIGLILEIFLIIFYAALFVYDPDNVRQPLGLPPATVRVFLISLIVMIIVIFAFLPDFWGNNKAVVLLFGLLSTIIGFYFGSRAGEGGPSTTPTIHLQVDPTTTTFRVGDRPKIIRGTLGAGWQSVVGTPPTPVTTVLLDNAGGPVGRGAHVALPDSDGKAEFDYTDSLDVPGSYVLRVVSPPSVVCDQRINVSP
jgi:hypothetical protein